MVDSETNLLAAQHRKTSSNRNQSVHNTGGIQPHLCASKSCLLLVSTSSEPLALAAPANQRREIDNNSLARRRANVVHKATK